MMIKIAIPPVKLIFFIYRPFTFQGYANNNKKPSININIIKISQMNDITSALFGWIYIYDPGGM